MELARQYATGTPVQIRTISDRLRIPSRFLVQILLQLKSAGLVTSTRGASGGYQLIRSPDEVSLMDIISAVDSKPDFTPAAGNDEEVTAERVVLASVVHTATEAYQSVLREMTLARLVEKLGDSRDPMYFI